MKTLTAEIISMWLDSLTDRQRFVVERRFGLNGHDVDTQESIGKKLAGVGSSSKVARRYRNKPGFVDTPGLPVCRVRVRMLEITALRLLKRIEASNEQETMQTWTLK